MVKEINVNLDLIEIFSLKKSSTFSLDLSQLNTFKNINFTKDLKHFQYGEFKTRLKIIKKTGSILFR